MTDTGVNIDSVLTAARAAPGMDPQSLYGMAQTSPDPSIAADNAQGTQAMAETTTAINILRSQDANHQRKMWASLSSDEQNMYAAGGYTPPAKPKHQSLFSKAVGTVGGAASDVFSAPTHLVTTAVGDTLHGLGSGLRQVQHVYRTAALVTDENEQNGSGRWSLGSLSEWASAWRKSKNGEQTFIPSRVAAITDKYGQDTVDLARQVASGKSPDQVILAAPEAQRQALAQRFQSDKNLQDAVTELSNAKISFGRRIVGQHLFQSNPKLASKLSGGFDALGDIAADPLVWGGKIAKAAELAPYIVSDGARVGEILEKPGAQRMLDSAAEALQTTHEGTGPNVGALIRRFPQFSQIGQDLANEGVTTADDLKQWFQGQAGMKAIMEGNVGGMAPHSILLRDPGVVVPNLSRVGAAAIPLKEAAGTAIEWAAEHHIPLTRSLERITQLTVPVDKLDPSDKNALTYLQRLADYALPKARANDLVSTFANATDRSQQFGTYQGLLKEVAEGMGLRKSEEGRAWMDQFLSTVADNSAVHSYGVGDQVILDGKPQSVGITLNHVMDSGWSVPDFRQMRALADKAYIQDKVASAVNGDKASWFMSIWKPAQLLRIGMPIRTAGEELVGAMLREGPIGLLRGRLAESSFKDGPLSPVHPLASALDLLTRHLPDSVVEKINTPRDLVGEVLGDRARRAFRHVEGKAANFGSRLDYTGAVEARLSTQEYVNAGKAIHDVNPDALPEEINAVHQHGAGFLDDAPTISKMNRQGVLARPAFLVPGDTFRDYTPGESLQPLIWQKNLDEYAKDPLFKAAFAHSGEDENAQVQAVVDAINDPKNSYAVKRSIRMNQTTDGRLVGDGATQEEAVRDWARVVVNNANHVTTDAAGTRFDGILDAVKGGSVPDIEHLNSIPTELRPATVNGPDMLPYQGSGKWREFTDSGFGRIGRMMNWIAREPIFVHNMATSMKEVEGFRGMYAAAAGADATAEHITQQLNETAFQRALNKTIPFIHDPQVRSQFAEDARNLAPFFFAQEQFMKRWANTAIYAPESFREAQLTMSGLRHSGLVRTDSNGNDFFMYPGAGAVQNLLSKTVSAFTGHDITLPIPVGFSGQVRFATPGTERLGAPSFGPLVSIPMQAITNRFPELQQLDQAVVGERGAGRPYWEQIVPASVARVVHVLTDNPETSPQMHSATLQAMQYLEATGHGLPETADPIAREAWSDRVKSWARILMLTRAIYGFSAPAAPELQIDANQMHSEFSQLVSEMPVGDAVKEFMRRHPDATAYTVFQTKNQAGAPLPATTDAMNFMNTHEDFLKTYPQAGAWFLPQSSGKTQFSQPAYREQLALGLRTKKGTEEYYKDIKFAEAATDYFDTKDGRDKRLADARANGDRAAITAIDQQWSEWSSAYLKAHPVFQELLLSPDGQLRRQHAAEQLQQALSDPNLPVTKQTTAIRDMSDTFNGLQTRLAQYKGQRDRFSMDARKEATQQFIDWAHSYIQDHPEVEGLYNSVFRLMVGDNQDTTNG